MNHKEVPVESQVNTSSEAKRFGKDTITYGIAVIIPALIGIISISIYTRIFSTEQFGQYNQVLNTALIITTLFSQWIQQSIQRYRPLYQNDAKGLRDFNTNLVNLICLMCVLILALGGLGSFFTSVLGSYEQYYWMSVLLILIQFLFLTFGSVLQADFKTKAYKNFNVLTSIFKFGIGLAFIIFVYRHPVSIMYGLILGQIFFISSMFKNTGMSIKTFSLTRWNETKTFTKQFMLYGFPMIGWFIGISILNLADRYMLEALGSVQDVGIYSANYSIVSASLGLLTTPLLTAAHPIIMNQVNKVTDKELGKLITYFCRIYMLISIPLLVFVTVFHREMTGLFLGEEFREGSIIIPVLFLSLIFWNLGMYGHKGYEIKEKTKIMLSFVVVSAIVNICLNYLLIPKYKYMGAAVATLISMAIYPLLVRIFSSRYIKWEINKLSTCRVVISAIITGLIVNSIKDMVFNNQFLQIAFGGCVGLVIYIILLFLFRELNYTEIKQDVLKKLNKR
ncbi:polysaccharide biosynthesis C-terminal domain-containing protein [Bacillus cereus]|uniref:oligosaccharide flippase family protein n=1 Tax=Bacillus cereus TaxID=1396 RepID=UPI0018F6DC6F|nr:lipopolysaccharide biosynthesis protein [Bacillus cereus]